MKYLKHLANSITLMALVFMAFSSFTSPGESENTPYYDYAGQGMLGEIRVFAGYFEPENWRFCDGRSIAIEKNSALYYIIGTIYGGDNTNFNLPDLRSKRLYTAVHDYWNRDDIAGQYMICTIGHYPLDWDGWGPYDIDGIPTGY